MLNNYSTKEIITFLREKRDIDIKLKRKIIKLKPYFGEVENAEEPITKWEGHFGFRDDGTLVLCTPNGYRIISGSLFSILSDGVIRRYAGLRDDTTIQLNKLGMVSIKS